MISAYVLAIVLGVVLVARERFGFAFVERYRTLWTTARIRLTVVARVPLWACCALVVLAYGAHVAYVDAASWPTTEAWQAALPVHVLTRPVAVWPGLSAVAKPNLVVTALALVESLALALLALRLAGRRLVRTDLAPLAIAAAVMDATAVFARSMTTADLYAYIAYARLGLPAAYVPPPAFGGTLAAIDALANAAWGSLEPAPYGPAWIALSSALFGHVGLGAAVLIDRLLDVACVGVVCAALVRMRFPAAVVALVALNPYVVEQFVIEAHNDVVALAAVFGAFAFVEANVLVAIVLVVLAGSIKAPYALVGALVFGRIAAPAVRIGSAVVTVVVTAAIGFVVGGRAYLAGGLFHATHSSEKLSLLFRAEHAFLIVVALAAIAFVVVRRTASNAATLAFATLTAATWPWYLALAFPYAAFVRTGLPWLLVALPIAGFLMDPMYDSRLLRFAAFAVLLVVVAGLRPRTAERQTADQAAALLA